MRSLRLAFAGRLVASGLILLLLLVGAPRAADAARGGELTLRVVEGEGATPVAVRMHLKRQVRDKLIPVMPPRTVAWKDHFAVDGELRLQLKRGQYLFEIERGPEYKTYRGHFEIQDHARDEKLIAMHRFVDMKREGWWSGDLHVHRAARDIELAMRSEDLHVAPLITTWQTKTGRRDAPPPRRGLVTFDGDRAFRDLAQEDERQGGALLFFNLEKPIDLAGLLERDGPPADNAPAVTAEYPSSVAVVEQAHAAGAHVDAEKPFWRDLPAWLATGGVDSIGLLNNHLWRDGVLDNEAWGRPRDRVLFPPPRGVGRWSEAIYYHVLEAGLRIPPSAGSASGVLPNPLGYNRVYVHCGDDFSYDTWWQNLRAGRVVVTNGPLIRPRVEGRLPGHVFPASHGDAVELEVGLTLSTREKIDYLEIVQNGRPVHTVRLDQFVARRGRLPQVEFDASGWFLVRAVTENQETYRLASTGPYYVEFDYQPRISRASCRFFLDWAKERQAEIEQLPDESHRAAIGPYHQAAVEFWETRLQKANAE